MKRNILALYASVNQHGNDAKGAFIPQAKGFATARRALGDVVELMPFDPTIANRVERRKAFYATIEKAAPFDSFVYFGHGLRTGLPSAGIRMADLDDLVVRIGRRVSMSARAAGNLVVVLYACSTAGAPGRDRDRLDGDGGCADELRDRLSVAGLRGWVDAHTVAGHTTINRMTRRFYLDGKAVGTGGSWLVAPGSPEWAAWGRALKDDKALRFGFPYMTESDLHLHLRVQ